MKTYTELCSLNTFEERYDYLKTYHPIGFETLGPYRDLVQALYSSHRWKTLRRDIIIRDNGTDMALEGVFIHGKITVHHINPITIGDLLNNTFKIYDPENLVCVSDDTHRSIHYNSDTYNDRYSFEERKPGDTSPWLHNKEGSHE